MTEHPILFSGEMVRAILAGHKTQTRRIVKPQPGCEWYPTVSHYHPTIIDRHGDEQPGAEIYGAADEREGRKFPYGKPGDRLWVRETWVSGWMVNPNADWDVVKSGKAADVMYLADAPHYVGYKIKWRPSIFMRRAASRITLEVTAVRVERVQDISQDDAIAEGLPCTVFARSEFVKLWETINGKRAPWASNPWVWVIEFQKIDIAPASGV